MRERPWRDRPWRDRQRMFETKSHSWHEAGLASQITQQDARRARREAILLVPLLVAVLLAYNYRESLFGLDMPVRAATVLALVILGWWFARDAGRAAGPALFRRLDPATAGTFGFLIRLATIGLVLLVALRIAGLQPQTLAVGGAVTAVILGLAAQQTLGNLIAGTVLLSARPFRVGDRVRLLGGAVGGPLEGVVSSLGLLYTTLAQGDETVLIPNNVMVGLAITPLREPASVALRARLRADTKPSDVQRLLEQAVSTPTRADPRIMVEEIDGDEVVVRIAATPEVQSDGPKLADEILAALSSVTRDGGQSASGARASAPQAPDEPVEGGRP